MNKSLKILSIVAVGLVLILGIETTRGTLANFLWTVFAKEKTKVAEQKVSTIKITKTFEDFQFSQEVFGMATKVTDLPLNTEILSLYVVFKEPFMRNGEEVGFQAIIKGSDEATECPTDMGTGINVLQQIFIHKMCVIDQSSRLYIRDPSASQDPFVSGIIDVFVLFISF